MYVSFHPFNHLPILNLNFLHLGSGDMNLNLSDVTYQLWSSWTNSLIVDLHYSEVKGFRGNLAIYSTQWLDLWWETDLDCVCIYSVAMYYNYNSIMIFSYQYPEKVSSTLCPVSKAPTLEFKNQRTGRAGKTMIQILFCNLILLFSSTFYPWHAQGTLVR